jgi:DNA-binding beta-propeller fold protein YncE
MMTRARRSLLGVLCAGLVMLGVSASAQGAAPEPEFVITPNAETGPVLQDPCGIVVNASGRLYVSSYYRSSVDSIQPPGNPPPVFPTFGPLMPTLWEVDPLSGPCGLGLDSANRLYVNTYHRNVLKFTPLPPSSLPTFVSAGSIDSSHPTGVAVDLATDNVYVDARDHIAAYDSSGAALPDIGVGSLGDGYGLAVSSFPATAGFIYVPDHSDDTVKVYNPLVDIDDPVQTIDGGDTPAGGFGSLRDSAVAVDRVTGEIYVADTLAHPRYSERAEAVIRVFDHTGAYKGRLKYSIVDGNPPGLAVDNSTKSTQGRVYAASGNTMQAGGIYAYPPGAATSDQAPGAFSLALSASGSGSGTIAGHLVGIDCQGSCEAQVLAGSEIPLTALPDEGSTFTGWSGAGCSGVGECEVEMTQARQVSASFEEPSGPVVPTPGNASARAASDAGPPASQSTTTQKGTLRIKVSGAMAPRRLPRDGAAPISVSVGGQISTTDRSLPPQLKSMRIELNKEGRLDSTGLPPCSYPSIQPGSSQRALSACKDSLVGEGSFTANITLAGQEPYPTKGKLLVFHSVEKGRPVLYGHIYSPKPFATSFVIVFEVQKLGKGTYGTALDAPLPAAMDAWGRLTGLQMTLSRRYSYKGKARSFISAGCPAPKGFSGATFPLARTEFSFAGGKKLSSVLSSDCKARG